MEAGAIVLGAIGGAWGFLADRIGARWPAHEDGSVRAVDWRTLVTVALGAVALGSLPGRVDDPLTGGFLGLYLVALVLLLATDLDQRLLPDVITLPLIPYAAAGWVLAINPFVQGPDIATAAIVAIGLPLVLFVLSIPFGAGAIGMGDLKLLVSVGLLAGLERTVLGITAGVLVSGLVILALLVTRRVTLKTYIPFGPFLILGAFWAILRP